MEDKKSPGIDVECLRNAIQREFEECVREVTEAVNGARDGSIIDDSEEAVRIATGKLRQKIFEKALQMKVDAAEAVFFPRDKRKDGSGLRHKGKQSVDHGSVNGMVRLERIYWWMSKGGRDERIDRLLGIAAATVSVGVRQMCCCIGIHQMGFSRGAEQLEHLAQIRISKERLRAVVESEGIHVLSVQQAGLLPAVFTMEDCRVSADGPNRIYTGMDGVKVAMVTEEEKDKRRKRRSRGKSGIRPRRRMRRGADNAYKEFKIATFYDQANTHRQVVATGGNHERLGCLLRREAKLLQIDEAMEKVGLADGAVWIDTQFSRQLPMLDARILDFYHLSEHVCAASNVCFGQGTGEAQAFSSQVLHIAKHEGPAALLARLVEERKEHRSPRKRKALDDLLGYLTPRLGMCDYPRFLERGWHIGSGPTEAMCKVMTYRLKGSGMRWDRQGAEAIMALTALRQSNTWESYWNLQKQVG